MNINLIRDFEAIIKNIDTRKEEVIDARVPGEFDKIDPIDGKKTNNIPNSKNIPYNELFDKENGIFKDKQELLKRINKIFFYLCVRA